MFSKAFLISSFFYVCIGYYILVFPKVYKFNILYSLVCVSLILCSFNYIYFAYNIYIGNLDIPVVKRHIMFILTSFPDLLSFIFGFAASIFYIRFLFQKKYMIKSIQDEIEKEVKND